MYVARSDFRSAARRLRPTYRGTFSVERRRDRRTRFSLPLFIAAAVARITTRTRIWSAGPAKRYIAVSTIAISSIAAARLAVSRIAIVPDGYLGSRTLRCLPVVRDGG